LLGNCPCLGDLVDLISKRKVVKGEEHISTIKLPWYNTFAYTPIRPEKIVVAVEVALS